MQNQSVFNPTLDQNGKVFCNNLSGQFFKVEGEKLLLCYTLPDSLKSTNTMFKFDDQNSMIISSKNLYRLGDDLKIKQLKDLGGVHTNLSKDQDGGIISYNSISGEIWKIKNGEVYTPDFGKNRFIGTNFVLSPYAQFYRKNKEIYFLNGEFGHTAIYSNGSWKKLRLESDQQKRSTLKGNINEFGIWFSYQNKGMTVCNFDGSARYNGKTLFPDYQISTGMVDAEGNYWLGTMGKGLLMIQNQNVLEFSNISSIEDDDLKCITVGEQNKVYVAGFKGKIYEFNDITCNEVYEQQEKNRIHPLQYTQQGFHI